MSSQHPTHWQQCQAQAGSAMFPALFNLLKNVHVTNLRLSYKNSFYSCFLCAEDVSYCTIPSVHGLQVRLNVCNATSSALLFEFGCAKSYCVNQFGKTCSEEIDSVLWGEHPMNSFKYLGIHVVGSCKQLMLDVIPIKQSFYHSCKLYFDFCQKFGRNSSSPFTGELFFAPVDDFLTL